MVGYLSFANDIVLVAKTPQEAEHHLKEEGKEPGSQLCRMKTKVMRNRFAILPLSDWIKLFSKKGMSASSWAANQRG